MNNNINNNNGYNNRQHTHSKALARQTTATVKQQDKNGNNTAAAIKQQLQQTDAQARKVTSQAQSRNTSRQRRIYRILRVSSNICALTLESELSSLKLLAVSCSSSVQHTVWIQSTLANGDFGINKLWRERTDLHLQCEQVRGNVDTSKLITKYHWDRNDPNSTWFIPHHPSQMSLLKVSGCANSVSTPTSYCL